MAEKGRIIRSNTECDMLRDALGIRLPHRAFLEEFRPGKDMYLRPESWNCLHGEGHSARVNVWGQILAGILGQKGIEVNPVTIGYFAQTHDLRRQDDDFDPEHGLRAADFFRSAYGYRPDGIIPTVTFLDTWHVPHDCHAPDIRPALAVAKDSDALDRVREEGSLDPMFLRLPESRMLVPLARSLFLLGTQYQEEYGADPHDCVMEAAVEMGLLTDR